MGARLLRWFFSTLLKLLSRSRAEGLHNVPPNGPYIMVGNHMSMADLPLAYTYLGGEHATGWVAEKWEFHPIFSPILRLGSGIFIQRGEVDRSALTAAVEWLKAGKVFGIAPEGTRSHNGQLQRGKTGAAYLADLADVPIVPVGMIGTEVAIKTLLRLQRPELLLRVGVPFRLPPLDPENRSASLRRNADEIMCRIAALLPARYWGYYRDHPMLAEILRQAGEADQGNPEIEADGQKREGKRDPSHAG